MRRGVCGPCRRVRGLRAARSKLPPLPTRPPPAAVRDFNQFDLYTKASSVPDIDAVWPFYQKIIDELCPGVLDW